MTWRVAIDRCAFTRASACLCALAVSGRCAGGSQATFTALGDLPGGDFHSHAFDVSDDGEVVVGWSKANSQLSGQYRAYRWTAKGGMTPLGHLGPSNAPGIARAISRDGAVIIGSCGVDFRWTQQTGMIELPGPCRPLNLSVDGSIMVGQCRNGSDLEAAVWSQATGWVSYGALGDDPVDAFFSAVSADGSVACGQSMLVLPNVEPIRWTKRDGMVALGDVPGGSHYALAWDISADGTAIVGEAIGDVGQDAFRWTAAEGLVNLEALAPGVTQSVASGVSGDGSVIVGAANNGINAMMWTPRSGVQSIQQVLAEEYGLVLPGWTLLGASAISTDGLTIVGHGLNPAGQIEGWRVRLPPPSNADINGDGAVNVADLLLVIASWGPCAPQCAADLDRDGTVNVGDLLIVIANWG